MEELYEIKRKFSRRQSRLHEKLKAVIGDLPSIALISLQGESQTSHKEIEVIAELVKQFVPLKLEKYVESPRKLILSGQGARKHSVIISPQFKIKNSNPKAPSWSVDLVIELFRSVGVESIKIGALGIEYDGHPSHYLETGIQKAYKRDMHIAVTEGIQLIRISPSDWDDDPSQYSKAIKKYCDRKIFDAEYIQKATVRLIQNFLPPTGGELVECPVCEGLCSLAGDFCPFCKGVGSVKRMAAENVRIEDFHSLECHKCSLISLKCKLCLGSGSVSLAKAIDEQKNEEQ
ncbi:hypothetical protein [Pseudomonas capsici]|uniref:hypothetical protein n=1 Tax=Pseudomonas capsici TaxID=2810614 RepID=UPI0021F15A2B|nr:hypothetical protein [Pseudomonas capsici]MCV4285659.1 hypothetical protein [Pseudomonas capsici]